MKYFQRSIIVSVLKSIGQRVRLVTKHCNVGWNPVWIRIYAKDCFPKLLYMWLPDDVDNNPLRSHAIVSWIAGPNAKNHGHSDDTHPRISQLGE
jgi:hypothetical protein